MKALIQNGGNTLLLDIPYKQSDIMEDISDHLGSIGVRKLPSELPITDKGDIAIQLIPETNMDKQLVGLIRPGDTLSIINTACSFLATTSQEIKHEVQCLIDKGSYRSVQEMIQDVQAMHEEQIQVIQVTLRSDFLVACCEDDYVLSLPKTDDQLRLAREHLGIKTFDDCEIMQVDSPIRLLSKIHYFDDVTLMNDIARAVVKATEQDGSKNLLMAVFETFKNSDVYELMELIEHLDCYELLPEDECNKERYGEKIFFQTPKENRICDELARFIDFYAYGMIMMEINGVHITRFGWLSPKVGCFKMYVPLVGREDGYLDTLNTNRLSMYQQEISDQLDLDVNKHLPKNGLIGDSKLPNSIKKKVLSVIPTVEVHNGNLWGCLQITKLGWITENELSSLSDEWYTQLKFGWGDHFRTQAIQCDDKLLFVDFWHESDDYQFFSEKDLAQMHQQTGWMDNTLQTGEMKL